MKINLKSILFAIVFALCTLQPIAAMNPLQEELMEAVRYGDAQKVSDLIAAGASVNNAGFDSDTPLMQAAINWDNEIGNDVYVGITQILLEKGAQINQTNEFGNTALMYAAGANNAPLCKLLLDQGAILETQQTNSGLDYSALHFAADDGSNNAITTLLTAIPLSEKLKIKKIICKLYQIKYAQPQLPRDVRRLITQEVIKGLVNDQMIRIEKLLLLQDHKGETARKTALDSNHPEAAQLLDLTNAEYRNEICKQIKNNVRRILLGEPQVKAEPKNLTHFEMMGVECDDSEAQAKEKIATDFLKLKGV